MFAQIQLIAMLTFSPPLRYVSLVRDQVAKFRQPRGIAFGVELSEIAGKGIDMRTSSVEIEQDGRDGADSKASHMVERKSADPKHVHRECDGSGSLLLSFAAIVSTLVTDGLSPMLIRVSST